MRQGGPSTWRQPRAVLEANGERGRAGGADASTGLLKGRRPPSGVVWTSRRVSGRVRLGRGGLTGGVVLRLEFKVGFPQNREGDFGDRGPCALSALIRPPGPVLELRTVVFNI